MGEPLGPIVLDKFDIIWCIEIVIDFDIVGDGGNLNGNLRLCCVK